MTRRILSFVCIGALAASLSGCSVVESAIYGGANAAGSSAGQTVGNEMGNRAGNAAVNSMGGPTRPAAGPSLGAAMSGQMMMFYTQYLFALAFGAGGYAVATTDFKPGQYTRYGIPHPGEDAAGTLERAYLGNDAEGNQWWKVKFTEPKKGETTILEALLSPKEAKMLRLRGKFPQDTEGKEMAVTENSAYVPPTRLSKKSVEGATKGIETVTVPAGTFKARHVVFGDVANTHEWWLEESVPGGIVRQASKTSGGASGGNDRGNYTMDLVAYGTDAKSELGTPIP